MKRNLLTFALVMLFAFSLSAQKKAISNLDKTPNANNAVASMQKAQWDVLFTFDALAAGAPGIETDGTNFYTTLWSGADFHRYDMDGANGTTFTVAGVANVRDMAYDGQYFYGAAADMNLYQMDLANETLVSTITATCTGVTGIRHISYDPNLDGGNGGFWIGNWSELGAIAMDGSELIPSVTGNADCYGSAYDNWSDPANPCIWTFQQGGVGAVFVQFDINTQTFTGVTHDADDIPGGATSPDLMAGGACSYEANGKFILAGSLQQDPNLIFGYELAVTAAPTAPNVATDYTAVADQMGAFTVDLAWTNPSIDVNGDALAELNSMEVLIDGVVTYTETYTNSTVGIGAMETYTATVATGGMHTFTVVGYNSAGMGIPVSQTVFVGEDVPEAPTNVLLSVLDMDATITWDAPVVGLNGGYFNPDNTIYEVFRNGTEAVYTGTATTYSETVVDAGVYYYTVVASNMIGEGGTGMTNSELIGDLLVFDFETGMPENFNLIDGDCGWMTGTDGSSTYFPIPAHTTYAYANDDACNGDMSDVWMILPAIDFTGVAAPFMSFESFSYSDIFTIKASTDGLNWDDIQVITPDNTAWKTETIDLSTYADADYVFLAFHYNDNDAWGYGWAVDDIMLNGVLAPVPPTYTVTFTVTDGTNPLEGASVEVMPLAKEVMTTDVNGVATFDLENGDYSYAVSMPTYDTYTGTFTVFDADVDIDQVNLVLTGINELNANVNVYPNPSNGVFTVSVNGTYNLQVVDITGKVISTQEITNTEDINIQEAGVYMLRLTNDVETLNYKVIVK